MPPQTGQGSPLHQLGAQGAGVGCGAGGLEAGLGLGQGGGEGDEGLGGSDLVGLGLGSSALLEGLLLAGRSEGGLHGLCELGQPLEAAMQAPLLCQGLGAAGRQSCLRGGEGLLRLGHGRACPLDRSLRLRSPGLLLGQHGLRRREAVLQPLALGACEVRPTTGQLQALGDLAGLVALAQELPPLPGAAELHEARPSRQPVTDLVPGGAGPLLPARQLLQEGLPVEGLVRQGLVSGSHGRR